jgi:hypothetical protein
MNFPLAKPIMLLVRTIIHRVPIYPDSSKKCFPTLKAHFHYGMFAVNTHTLLNVGTRFIAAVIRQVPFMYKQ